MSEETKTTEAPAATAEKPARKFIYNGMGLDDITGLSPEQIRDVYAGNYPSLTNAKVKGPEKGEDGAEVFTFVENIGKLG